MASELQDSVSFEGSIPSGDSESLIAKSSPGEYYELLVDDGSSSLPTAYDIKVEIYSTSLDAFVLADIRTDAGPARPAIIDNCRGQSVRVTITNQADVSENFRISLETFREI